MLHVALGASLFLLLKEFPTLKSDSIDFEFLDHPKMAAKAVFGIAKRTEKVEQKEGLGTAIKQGNTLAKESDQEAGDDSKNLPSPTDEYLVSSMPKLSSEYRIPYPPEAKKKGIQGPVVMDLLIDANGTVRDVKLISSPSPLLSESALAAIKNFKFIPAQIKDKSVAIRIRYSYRFVLER